MIKIIDKGCYLLNNDQLIIDDNNASDILKSKGINTTKEDASKNTMAYSILSNHNSGDSMEHLNIKFDSLASHDITYVGIIQTAKASGMTKFPLPYVLTNCHNSLCAVGGTINEDDHKFGLSAAIKYGGDYVPAHQAVIHQYIREVMTGCGKMILGSDSHTRYGALGTMAIGEGGGELAKQLINKTYDIKYPGVIGIHLIGKPAAFIGPQDVSLAIIGAVFKNGFVKNKVMEFFGEGVSALDAEFRIGIDVMTTETTCLSSIWTTDEKIQEYYTIHGRSHDYKKLEPGNVAYYDGILEVDLSKIKPMIAMPFHPSNVYTIDELNNNLQDIINIIEKTGNEQLGNSSINFTLKNKIKNGSLYVDQGIIAGCAGGTYSNICDAADIINGKSIGQDYFTMSVYPASQPIYNCLIDNGSISKLMKAGVTIRSAFCGPCFGAGDTPSNNSLSIRHTTRNFPNREGSKPSTGQIASVALMDAKSIAATAINDGKLTSAENIDFSLTKPKYHFSSEIYKNRIYKGYGHAKPNEELLYGPNIVDWPEMTSLTDNIILQIATVITDPVTTTDELIPSGETSSYRSNPLGLAEFTLSRKDPAYVGFAKEVHSLEKDRLNGVDPTIEYGELANAYETIKKSFSDIDIMDTSIGSAIYAIKPGDGSAREQAASCQKVLGGLANIAKEYATKRYFSNLINWGIVPFICNDDISFKKGDFIFVPNIKNAILSGDKTINAYIVRNNDLTEINLSIPDLTENEKQILVSGCLINFNKNN